MKASKFRDMSVDQLESEAIDLSNQLFRLRFQQATGQVENVQKMSQVRKDLARVKTILTEKARPA
jgi:large subunit ribosomal protein L29